MLHRQTRVSAHHRFRLPSAQLLKHPGGHIILPEPAPQVCRRSCQQKLVISARFSALRQARVFGERSELPAALRPRETRAARWIMALRSADALAAEATHQEMARTFFGPAIAAARWRTGSEAYRSRIQRLVRTASIYLDNPFRGPWFRCPFRRAGSRKPRSRAAPLGRTWPIKTDGRRGAAPKAGPCRRSRKISGPVRKP